MSAFEPHVPTEPKVDMPDFMIVLRGFDRRQVEMWAAEVANQIEQERLRADEAERKLYRMQIENKGAPSFSHLGSHVASILEEAGRSSENMLADAADRAQETVEAAEGEAGEIIKAAEHRAGEIEQEARHILEDARAEGSRVEEDALQAAEEMRAQAEQDARTVLEEARDATDMIWQEAERERIGVEAETIRLETLRHRSLEQLNRVYGHLETVLDEVRAGIGRVEEEEENLAEATAAAAARLGVEPPASNPEDSPRFPSIPAGRPSSDEILSANRPDTPAPDDQADPTKSAASEATTEAPADPSREADETDQPALSEVTGDATSPDLGDATPTVAASEATGATEATTQQVAATEATSETEATAEQVAATEATEETQPVPAAEASDEVAAEPAPNGERRTDDQDATQRLEPVGGKGRQTRSASRDAKDRP